VAAQELSLIGVGLSDLTRVLEYRYGIRGTLTLRRLGRKSWIEIGPDVSMVFENMTDIVDLMADLYAVRDGRMQLTYA